MRTFRTNLIWMIFAAILFYLPTAAFAAGKTASRDKSFVAAYRAFLAGKKTRFVRHAERARGHVLEAYIDLWRLRLNLAETDPFELRTFLARNAGTVLAELLREDWLRVLGKNKKWEIFREEYPVLVKADPDVACYALQERWLRKDKSVSDEIKSLWRLPQTLPVCCQPVVKALLNAGELAPQDVRDRFRLLVQANLMAEARRIVKYLPADQAPATDQIKRAARSPARFLKRSNKHLRTPAGRELVIVALACLARNDLRSAVRFWNAGICKRFPVEDQQYVWAMIAVQGARCHVAEAVDWFDKAGEFPLSDDQIAWRARIALRQQNWPEVKKTIGRMSLPQRNEPVWIYWLGRSLCAIGEHDAGRKQFRRIAGDHHFYGRLAAEELGMPLKIPPKAEPPTKKEIAEVAARGGIKRALALHKLGLCSEARAEWMWAVKTMQDRTMLAAAELARRNRIWDHAINTADQTITEHDFSIRYPLPYRHLLLKHARKRKLNEALVFGMVRQESRFIAEARSAAGALGLMQVLPSTARMIARKIGVRRFRASRLTQPELNATFGTFYLRQVLDEFNGNEVLAAAAYNAGPARARRWRGDEPLEGAIYVETIPFPETRRYVKNVMTNAIYYAAVLHGEKRSLRSYLGTVNGSQATAGEIGDEQ